MTRFPSTSSSSIALVMGTLVALAYASGCSSASKGSTSGNGPSGPHALGAVLLGESHAPGGSSMPQVSAAFIPDSSALPQACSGQVDGCTVVAAPQCGTG